MYDKAPRHFFYLFNGRFPSEKAHALYVAHHCSSLASAGLSATLVVPRRFQRLKECPFSYYGVPENFRIVYLPTLDLFPVPTLSFVAHRVSSMAFALVSFVYLAIKAPRDATIASHEALPILFASYRFPYTLLEVHDYPERSLFLYRLVFRRVRVVLSQSKWKKEQLSHDFSIPFQRVVYEPNAVDYSKFSGAPSKEEARRALSLPHDATIVMYTGHLYSWKGVDTLARASRDLPPHFLVYFVGGTDADIVRFTKKYGTTTTIRIVGHRPPHEMPLWQAAADILAVPNTAREPISERYTSPMKVFEYMASGRPIIASDIPSLREILDDSCAFFVPPDDAPALREAILSLVNDKERMTHLAAAANKKARACTWDGRAARLVAYLSQLHHTVSV